MSLQCIVNDGAMKHLQIKKSYARMDTRHPECLQKLSLSQMLSFTTSHSVTCSPLKSCPLQLGSHQKHEVGNAEACSGKMMLKGRFLFAQEFMQEGETNSH